MPNATQPRTLLAALPTPPTVSHSLLAKEMLLDSQTSSDDPEQKICSSLNPQIEFLLILSLIDLHMVSDPPKRREDREV
jgi:hypothetical protein